MARSYNNIGAIYYDLKNYESAIAFYKLGAEKAYALRDSAFIVDINLNLLSCYVATKNYKDLDYLLEEIERVCKGDCYIQSKTWIEHYQGIIAYSQGNYDEAKSLLSQSASK